MKNFDSLNKNYDRIRSTGILGWHVRKERKLAIKGLDVNKGDTILDAGCGSGVYSEIIKKSGGIPFGVDSSENMIKEYRKKGMKGIVCRIEDISFKNKFDKLICAGALEFIEDSDSAVRALHDSLKKNGIIVVVYPRNNFFGILYKIYHLSRLSSMPYFLFKKNTGIKIKIFSKEKINKLFEMNKFKVIWNKKANVLTSVLVARKE